MKFSRAAANVVGWLGLARELIEHGSGDGKHKDFVTLFGLSPGTCAALWMLCRNDFDQRVMPIHFLWTLLFVAQYGKENLHCIVARVTRKTFRKCIFLVLLALSSKFDRLVSNPSSMIFVRLFQLLTRLLL